MSVALIGRKAGMTRIFTDAGETVPVTVIEVLPNRINIDTGAFATGRLTCLVLEKGSRRFLSTQ